MLGKISIACLAMMDSKPHLAVALYDYEAQLLYIHSCTPANPNNLEASEWVPELKERLRQYVEKGFSVLIEDITGAMVIDGTTPFSFDDLYEKRPTLYHALDYNFSMQSLRQVTYNDNITRFIIQGNTEGSKIDILQDDKGRKIYRVDWTQFNGGHKAVLMCICAAMMPPVTNSYLETMFEMLEDIEEDVEESPLSTWNKITVEHSIKEYLEYESQFDETI
jgi:hypothetical protein